MSSTPFCLRQASTRCGHLGFRTRISSSRRPRIYRKTSSATTLNVSDDAALLTVAMVHGKIDLEQRAEVGAAGELRLVELLEEQWPGSTRHVALEHDGLDDVAFTGAGATWHLEVKSTTRRGRLVVHLSRAARGPSGLRGAGRSSLIERDDTLVLRRVVQARWPQPRLRRRPAGRRRPAAAAGGDPGRGAGPARPGWPGGPGDPCRRCWMPSVGSKAAANAHRRGASRLARDGPDPHRGAGGDRRRPARRGFPPPRRPGVLRPRPGGGRGGGAQGAPAPAAKRAAHREHRRRLGRIAATRPPPRRVRAIALRGAARALERLPAPNDPAAQPILAFLAQAAGCAGRGGDAAAAADAGGRAGPAPVGDSWRTGCSACAPPPASMRCRWWSCLRTWRSLKDRLGALDAGTERVAGLEAAAATARAAYLAAGRALTEARQPRPSGSRRRLARSCRRSSSTAPASWSRSRRREESGWAGRRHATASPSSSPRTRGRRRGTCEKIASGGELSRLMLALKVVLAPRLAGADPGLRRGR